MVVLKSSWLQANRILYSKSYAWCGSWISMRTNTQNSSRLPLSCKLKRYLARGDFWLLLLLLGCWMGETQFCCVYQKHITCTPTTHTLKLILCKIKTRSSVLVCKNTFRHEENSFHLTTEGQKFFHMMIFCRYINPASQVDVTSCIQCLWCETAWAACTLC